MEALDSKQKEHHVIIFNKKDNRPEIGIRVENNKILTNRGLIDNPENNENNEIVIMDIHDMFEAYAVFRHIITKSKQISKKEITDCELTITLSLSEQPLYKDYPEKEKYVRVDIINIK